MKPIFFVSLAFLYLSTDAVLTRWYRRTFNRDDNFIGARAPNAVQRFFGRAVYVVLAYYALVLVALLTGFDFWGLVSPVTILDRPGFQIAGLTLGLICLALMTLARVNLGRAWRVGLDYGTTDGLVTTGFYRYIRNPYFAFSLGFQAALFLVAPNALVLCAFVQSAILLGLQARHEEAFLEARYGAEYVAYKRATGRFLPHLRRPKSRTSVTREG